MDDIETARLILRRLPPDAIDAGLSGDREAVERHLHAKVPTDLIEDPVVLQFAKARLAEDPAYLPWSVRALILKASGEMVGHIRFHTRPDPDYLRCYAANAVEFGYVVFAAHRRHRYAREAVDGLMLWAEREHGISRFVVTIAPANLPSLQLAARSGFRKIGQHVDPVDGVEDIYLRGA